MAAIRERDRLERRAWDQEQEEAEERRLAPVRAMEEQLRQTHGKVLTIERDAVAHGQDNQAASLLSDAMKAITPERGISEEQACAFNETEALRFAESTPSFYACPENADTITGYFSRNGINVADVETYRNVFRRLDSLGLMQHRPVPQSEPVIEQQTAPVQTEFEGVDDSGRVKLYSKAEVGRMSADDYKRYFRLPSKQFVEYQEAGTRW